MFAQDSDFICMIRQNIKADEDDVKIERRNS